MEDLFTGLNPEQIEAVKHTKGPALVVAGPGSGKTRVLTHHAAYLISQGVRPENILLVTFTNKAAQEMKERISRIFNFQFSIFNSKLPWSGTFHSVCSRILRREGRFLGLSPNFSIFDEADSRSLIKKAVKKLKLDESRVNPQAALSAISGAKNELIGPEDYQNYARGYFYQNVSLIFGEYQKELKQNQALDFDDLLFFAVKLFRENKAALSKYQGFFKHVLVDEYQDTNKAQYVLAKLISQKHQNIYVVGDMSQAIYSFRGADYRNILNFERDFPKSKVYRLSQNYRSTSNIIEAAANLIANNKTHLPLNLWTQKRGGGKIKLFEAANELDEADYIIKTVLNEQATFNSHPPAGGSTLNSYAVLYRTNAQSRAIEEAFLRRGLPYVLVGGTRFYERKEIKDIISLLRLLRNPQDSLSSERILKIGKKFGRRYLDWLASLKTKEGISKNNALEVLDEVLKESGYLEIFDEKIEEERERIENVKELRSVAAGFINLEEFLENVQLVQNEYLVSDKGRLAKENRPNAISLMTLHSAKGLEFPVVFMVGLEEGLLPHSRSLLDPSELEEERRLCYVGITRCQEDLHLIYTRSRFYFGVRQAGVVSRFIGEIPQHLLEFKKSNYFTYD
ncbi:MAG: UvrD-helicase domain-containing protein [Patescibacteria group bacterium]|nr:UvrD-helicase domain-containing protein [Patescibacteria group bacterium]